MSDETIQGGAAETGADSALPAEDDAALGAVWDRLSSEGGDEGASDAGRDASGRFTAKAPQVEGEADKAAEPGAEPGAGVKLPANMTPDMADVFEGMPPERAEKLTAWADRVHRQMSEQGRQIAAYRGYDDVVTGYRDYFASGEIQPAHAFKELMSWQKQFDTDPAAAIQKLAGLYKVNVSIDGRAPEQADPAGKVAQLEATITDLRARLERGVAPDAIRGQVEATLAERQSIETVTAFASEKPLWREVEPLMPNFIPLARQRLGEDAAPRAVLEYAYDAAIHADPDLRKRVQAADEAARTQPKKAEALKRATAVNVKSAPSGSRVSMTEEEEMGAVYDRLKAS